MNKGLLEQNLYAIINLKQIIENLKLHLWKKVKCV